MPWVLAHGFAQTGWQPWVVGGQGLHHPRWQRCTPRTPVQHLGVQLHQWHVGLRVCLCHGGARWRAGPPRVGGVRTPPVAGRVCSQPRCGGPHLLVCCTLVRAHRVPPPFGTMGSNGMRQTLCGLGGVRAAWHRWPPQAPWWGGQVVHRCCGPKVQVGVCKGATLGAPLGPRRHHPTKRPWACPQSP